MASQKNQHFVPKVHLVPFTTNRDEKSISLFHIKSVHVIHGAPIKSQCSGNYFYGTDRVFENLLASLEGMYAQIVREIEGGEISKFAIRRLSMFMALQYCRTRQAVDGLREFLQKASAITLRGQTVKEDRKPDLSHKALIFGSLRQFKWLMPYLRDLEFCVIRNRTKIPLLTSDNPLIYTNRFYLQRLGQDNFGVSSAGVILILPIGPRYAVCLYDAGMYSVDHRDGFVEIKKGNDIQALNEMQYLNADKNVYFSTPDDGDRIRADFEAAKHLRPSEKARMMEFAELEKGHYRRIDEKIDESNLNSKMVMFQIPRPRISRWPSMFSFRLRPKAFTNGSAIGYVRKPEWLTKEGRL